MPTRNVVLTEHHQKTIDRLVRSGRYQNASEVLREGLRLIEQREREDETKLKVLREAARAGLADIKAGRVIEVREEDLDSYIAAALPRGRKKKN
jgi:antitoxin ParD1/3/4